MTHRYPCGPHRSLDPTRDENTQISDEWLEYVSTETLFPYPREVQDSNEFVMCSTAAPVHSGTRGMLEHPLQIRGQPVGLAEPEVGGENPASDPDEGIGTAVSRAHSLPATLQERPEAHTPAQSGLPMLKRFRIPSLLSWIQIFR